MASFIPPAVPRSLRYWPAHFVESRKAVAYAAAIPTSRMFLTHLYGFHYAHPDQIWTFAHAGMLMDGLFCLRPDLEVIIPRIGEGYDLQEKRIRM